MLLLHLQRPSAHLDSLACGKLAFFLGLTLDTYGSSWCWYVQAAGLLEHHKQGPPVKSAQDIIEFIFFPVVNEGCRVIAEGIVDKPADLDVATVLAMGFPPYRCILVQCPGYFPVQTSGPRIHRSNPFQGNSSP